MSRKRTKAQREAWARIQERQRRADRAAFVRGDDGAAVPLDGETSWSLQRPRRDPALDKVVENFHAVSGKRFPPGYVWPAAADGPVYVIINRRLGINCVMIPEGGPAIE